MQHSVDLLLLHKQLSTLFKLRTMPIKLICHIICPDDRFLLRSVPAVLFVQPASASAAAPLSRQSSTASSTSVRLIMGLGLPEQSAVERALDHVATLVEIFSSSPYTQRILNQQ